MSKMFLKETLDDNQYDSYNKAVQFVAKVAKISTPDMKRNELTLLDFISELLNGEPGNNEFQRYSKQIYDSYQEPIRNSQLSNHVGVRVPLSGGKNIEPAFPHYAREI